MSERTLFDPAEQRRRGRIGGFVTAARYDGREQTALARRTYRESFADHSACGVCRNPAPVPDGLSPAETARRAEAMRRAHYARLAHRSARVRAGRGRCSRKANGFPSPETGYHGRSVTTD